MAFFPLSSCRAFFMEKVLAQAACFQPLRDAGNMQLSPNCLVQLEVTSLSPPQPPHHPPQHADEATGQPMIPLGASVGAFAAPDPPPPLSPSYAGPPEQ